MIDKSFIYIVVCEDEYYHAGFVYEEAEEAWLTCTKENVDKQSVLICYEASDCGMVNEHTYLVYNPSN